MASKAEKFFSKEQREQIVSAIKQAELQTSGEVRMFIEDKCKADVLDRAAFLFAELQMHKTAERNGVLFYLALSHRKFAILGDAGINAVVEKNFWDDIKHKMLEHFKAGNFTEGLTKGITMAGEALKKYFPHQLDDVNELDDDIVFGK